jgi:outer membrane protein OmpA-like peptidoglycan-associated protein
MKAHSLRSALVVAGAGLLLATARAGGEPHSGIDALLFRPALDTHGVWSLDSAKGLKQYDFGLKLDVGYAQDPLDVGVPGIGTTEDDIDPDAVLKYALTLDMTVAFAFTDRLSFGLDVGMVRTLPDDGYGERGLYRDSGPEPSTGLISLRPLSNIDPSGDVTQEGHSVPTDVRVGGKYRLLTGKLGLAVLGIVSVPFGDEEMFLGDASFVFEPKVAVDYSLGENSRIVANLGARLRKRTVLEAYNPNAVTMPQTQADAKVVMDVGSELVAGAGFLYELVPQLIVAAEAALLSPLPDSTTWGSCTLNSGAECKTLEDADYFGSGSVGDPAAFAVLGINYRATPDASLNLAGGTARLMGDGRGETFRVMAGVSWSPTPAGTRVIGRGDADGDEVPDRIDICPDEPEDRDNYQDDDGCPDLDNDGDGIIDAKDACTDEPEDKDGYQDDDGCPEPDNDNDGVPDVTDRCPNDKEDADGWEDDDGCPEEDNDGDGIADDKDQCANEPETVNGYQDLDGCPDEAARGGPQLDPDRINLRGSRIEFGGAKSAKLTKASRTILDDIVRILQDNANRDVRIRIEVHVPLGTTSTKQNVITAQQKKDKTLSGQRADAIREYLLRAGVDVARLQAVGIGSDRPMAQPASAPENERIDLIRTEQTQ